MRDLQGQTIGDQTLDEDMRLQGQIVGDCRVPGGRHLVLSGQVTGDLVVDLGGSAVIRGMVGGNLHAMGHVRLHGMVIGTADGEGLEVMQGSTINGVTQ